MFESEVNKIIGSKDEIPFDILRQFQEGKEGIVARTMLPFGEHCTECLIPKCYSTCKFYVPRIDTKCSRFIQGMVRIDAVKSLNNYLIKVSFKSWGKLWTIGNMHLFSLKETQGLERRDRLIAFILQSLPLPRFLRARLIFKRYDWKKYMYKRLASSQELPSYFLLECYNPQNYSLKLSIVISLKDEEKDKMPFRSLIDIKHGFNRVQIPVSEISKFLDFSKPFAFSIIPNEISSGTVLYFGAWDFVKDINFIPSKSGIYKCVVWDLDNTIWDGILMEDGKENLRLKSEVMEVIKELDSRGILNSIVSKNDREEVLEVLEQFKIAEYFLYPQISFIPKSEGIRRISNALNIGLDTIIFVDDSEFERAEVLARCPEVKTISSSRYDDLIKMKECQVVVTSETRNRRKMYQEQIVRESAQADFQGDYLAFLANCKIELKIKPLEIGNLERIYELAQRTNQMNFTGNRYELSQLSEILVNKQLGKYVLECNDRFGNYGIVGFSLIDSLGPTMIDLMFSCRVMNKRLEHAFLSYVLKKYIRQKNSDFFVRYRKTPRNVNVAKVFDDFGFEKVKEVKGVTFLVFHKDKEIFEEDIISIILK